MPILTADERLGTQLAGKYRLDRVIGRGGMGVVFSAVHLWTGRTVAVKLLHSEYTGEPALVTRFLNEARAAAALAHPNVVEVLDVGTEADGGVYIALEFLYGETLSARIDRCVRLSPHEAARILLPVMDALAVAHARGIIHRDLKPENVFCVRAASPDGAEVPKLLDFGIAKFEDADSRATRTGHAMGTPAYMAPEQVRSAAHAGPAADIWSMGVAWFESISGRLPYDAVSPQEMMAMILTQAPMSLHECAHDAPPALCDAVDVALRIDPMDRWPTMESFSAALHEALGGAAHLSNVPPVTGSSLPSRLRPRAPAEPPVQFAVPSSETLPYVGGPPRAPVARHAAGSHTLAPVESPTGLRRRLEQRRISLIATASGGALLLAVGVALALGVANRRANSVAASAATSPHVAPPPPQAALAPAPLVAPGTPPANAAHAPQPATATPTPAATVATTTRTPPALHGATTRPRPVTARHATTRANNGAAQTPAAPARPRIVPTW